MNAYQLAIVRVDADHIGSEISSVFVNQIALNVLIADKFGMKLIKFADALMGLLKMEEGDAVRFF